MAVALSKRGCNLALADIDPAGLEETAGMVQGNGLRVSTHVIDVRDKELGRWLPALMEEQHGGIDLLFNNAGVAAGGDFSTVSAETFEWLMDINFHAVVRLTRAFLPQLKSRPEARIVNISSVFGIIAPAEQTAYSASKFAVRGFSNALRHELRGSNVSVSVVHPGGVATNIANRAVIPETMSAEEAAERLKRENRLLRMPPLKAGEIIVNGVARDKPRILVGSDAVAIMWLERLFPVNYWAIADKVMKSISS
jgi:short-subunit dehydrogenase